MFNKFKVNNNNIRTTSLEKLNSVLFITFGRYLLYLNAGNGRKITQKKKKKKKTLKYPVEFVPSNTNNLK